VLTALGESARRYVVDQFSSLGSNLLIVLPGRSETRGGLPPLLGETPRPLTLEDGLALARAAGVRRVAPLSVGGAEASYGARTRECTVVGTTADYAPLRRLKMAQGRFIATPDPRAIGNECVIGGEVRRELFGSRAALGEWLRLGDRRCRIVGVLGTTSVALGVDMGEIVILPVASALNLFNSDSLFRVLVETRSRDVLEETKVAVRSLVRARHEGEDDVTVIAQDAVVSTFDRILTTLTYGVAAIAAVALLVAGILVMNVMLVAVVRRTPEIGLLRALGARAALVQSLFLAEAAALAVAGSALGLVVGQSGVLVLNRLYPALAFAAPWWAFIAAPAVAVAAGIVFGWLPARRAARLDPVQALTRRA
jgi:putative ABC transport system permease protein